MATLTQVQQAVNYVNGYAGGNPPALPSGMNGNNIIAIILQALGYYTGAVTGTLSSAVGSPLTMAYIQFHNAVFGGSSPVSTTPLTAFGGPPVIYPALAHVASQALAAASAGSTPGAGGAAPATSSGSSSYSTQPYGGETYTVKSGDTLSAIASMYGISLSALEAANPQITNPDLIYVGEVINIPAAMTSVAVPTAGTPPVSQDGGAYTQSGSPASSPAASSGGITGFLSSTGGKIAAGLGLVGLALAFKRKS